MKTKILSKKACRGIRQTLSMLLVLVMLLGLAPLWALPTAQAAATVTYVRKNPEVAILNAYTGQDTSFYSKLVATSSDYRDYYNAIKLFDNGEHAYSDSVTSGTWTFDFTQTVLKSLASPEKNLKVNVSATFHNRVHPHTSYNLGTKYDYTVATSHQINVGLGGELKDLLYPDKQNTLSVERVGDYTGDDNYITVDPYLLKYETDSNNNGTYYAGDNLKLKFYQSNPVYDGKVCTCGGSYVEKVLVTFRDTRSPQLSSVQYSVDGGASYTDKSSGVKLRGGQTLKIKLTYDEYIRFADDNADGKDKLYLNLSPSGAVSSTYYAYLTELQDNYMVFTYTVPYGSVDDTIAALSLDSLFDTNSGITLKQVSGSTNFSIKEADKSGTGFTTTTCYVTDLAGNALTQSTITDPNLTLDAGAPYVAKISYTLGLNNSDVKAALGKTDPNDKDYTDKSDLYLGVGDTLNVTIRMNEQLKGLYIGENGANRYQLDCWGCVTATTNIKKSDGTYVTLSSLYFTPYQGTQSGGASTQSGATAFVMQGVTVEEGWKLKDGDTTVKITNLSIGENIYTWDSENGNKRTGKAGDTVSDLAGNTLNKTNVRIADTANANPPYLDTTAPEVTEVANSYFEKTDGFRYGINISDSGSGVAGISGSFILNNNGDKKAYAYEWAVTGSAEAPDSAEEWQTGTTGKAQSFTQLAGDNYLHIRQKKSESYENLSGCTITVKAKDYAGNEGKVEFTPKDSNGNSWYIDKQAPSIKAGSSERELSGDTGTLTVRLSLSDLHGISAWQYAWGDDATTAPTGDWENGDVTATSTSAEVSVSLSKTVGKGTSFAKYLWVKATDNAGNNAEDRNTSAAVCLGRYAYDLGKISYDLTYSQEIADSARIYVKSLSNPNDGTGTLLFLVPAAKDSNYYGVFEVNAGDNRIVGVSTATGNIFSLYNADSWSYYEVTEKKGIYTFTADEAKTAENAVKDAYYNNLSGTLTVKVLSGKKEAIARNDSVIASVGDGSYTFSEDVLSLRVAGPTPRNNFENISIAAVNADDLGKTATSTAWKSGGDYYRTTLAGLSFTVSIGKDLNGWNYEDVDWAKSYISFVNKGDSSKTYAVNLGPFQTTGSTSATQTVTVPEGEYASGAYDIELYVAFASSASSDKMYSKSLTSYVVVDNTAPNSDFALSSVVFNGVGWSSSDGGRNTAYGGENENTWTCYTAGDSEERIYIPAIHSGGDVYSDCTLTVDSPSEAALGSFSIGTQSYSTGRYYVKIWNTKYADDSVCIEMSDEEDTDGNKTGAKEQTTAQEKVIMVDGSRNYAVLHLDADQENTVAVQKVYENGRTSDIKYYTLYYDTTQITGSVSIENEQVVFTPDTDSKVAAADGASIYAYAWRSGENASNSDTIKRIEMTAQNDGTWRCALEQEYIYQIFTVNKHGCVKADSFVDIGAPFDGSFVSQRSPWFTDSIYGLEDNQPEGLTVTNNANGTYTLTFCVRDDAYPYCDTNEYTIGVSFGEGYPAQSFTFKTADLDNSTWTTSEISPSGIFEVKQTSYTQYNGKGGSQFVCRNYAITGYYAMATDNTMEVTVSVTDKDGLTGTVTSKGNAVNYQAPTVTGSEFTETGLTLTFTQPVRPVESWAWHETDSNSTTLAKPWTGAFPISGNGTWTIEFMDIFGNVNKQKVDVGNAFTKGGTDYSILVSLSETEETTKPVTLATSAADGTLLVYRRYDATSKEYLASVGSKEVDSSTGSYSDDSNIGARSRVTELTESRRYYVELLDTSGTAILTLPVNVYNIVSGAPEATVYYYVEDLGQEFTESGLKDYIRKVGSLTVAGKVTVRYTTSRHVTATGDTGTEHTFTAGNTDPYTFKYVDDFGNERQVTVSLPAGLALTEYTTTPLDTQPPVVDVQVYAKRGGAYSLEAAFLGTDDAKSITDTLSALSYVQGYSMVLKVTDASDYTIALVTPDDKPDGAALVGNVLTVTKAGTYTVTVTDTSKNKQDITITVPALLDNQAPVVNVQESAKSMYERAFTVAVTDKDDAGVQTNTVTPILPADITLQGTDSGTGTTTYTYSVTENGNVVFRFRDFAGNVSYYEKKVTSLDTDPPKLTVEWSPGLEKGKYPPTESVKTDITAHIDSDKAMYGVTVRTADEDAGASHALLTNGVSENAYTIKEGNKTLVTISATPERITVTYADNYETPLIFTATAPNDKSTTLSIKGPTNLIDQTAPTVYEEKTELMRSSEYSAPYAVQVTLTPNEDALCASYGDKCYNADNPLTVTYTENGTYQLRFTDRVGNITTYPVEITGIDSTAPQLELLSKSGAGQTAKVTVTVNEPCTVKWGDNGTHTFTAAGSHDVTINENGTYAFTATDSAGNQRTRMVVVGDIDNVAPTISFTKSTVYVMAGDDAALKDELGKGYETYDNVTANPTCVNNGLAAVNINTPGQYTVTYTVTDAAENTTTGTRLVRVIGAGTVCLKVDNNLVMPGSTAVLKSGVEHTLSLVNNGTEPYTVKARKGVLSEGQMKYLSGSSLSFNQDGKFTVTSTGYYTLLVTTQSRQTIRILLYVER